MKINNKNKKPTNSIKKINSNKTKYLKTTDIELNSFREQIKLVDKNIALLFEKRMNLVTKIAKYKLKNNLPILDKIQEKKVIINAIKNIKNSNLKIYYEKFLKNMINISKKIQNDIINKK